jgi:DNA invertase Pin-like site-specific DNA recombinase
MEHQNAKITHDHLARRAVLYVRQSSIRQVHENQESTKRQYALKQSGIALGWPDDMIDVIDEDLGISGAATNTRSGYKKLVSEVSQENIGIVISIEASRLSRSSSDWSNLLEICRLTHTLILDEDGLYDPSDFNDRMLLGLKGTMSEAELHYLCARMKGGLDNKAKRGELKIPIPVGYVYDDFDQLVKDPDENVQSVVRLVFDTYARLHSCQATLKELSGKDILFPKKDRTGYNKNTIQWRKLTHVHILKMIHNPIYAGIYRFGLRKYQKTINGYRIIMQDKSKYIAYIEDHHDGYITNEQYQRNQQYLDEHRLLKDTSNPARATAVRQGCALLQGIAYCGKCGRRMGVRYTTYPAYGTMVSRPAYWCVEEKLQTADTACQRVSSGTSVDQAVGEILVEMVTPLAMASVIEVQNELVQRNHEIDALKQKELARCKKEMDTARFRFLNTDPANTLVLKRLESDWNEKIRIYEDHLDAYERDSLNPVDMVSQEVRNRLTAMAADFKTLWRSPDVTNEEKKRIVRFLVETVLITQYDDHIHLTIQFKAGTLKELDIDRGKRSYETWRTPPEALRLIDEGLSQLKTPAEVASMLNSCGLLSGKGLPFTRELVNSIVKFNGIKSLEDRFLEMGYVSQKDVQNLTSLSSKTLKHLRDNHIVKDFKASANLNYWYVLDDFRDFILS